MTERRVAEDAGGTGRAVKAGRCGGVRLLTGDGARMMDLRGAFDRERRRMMDLQDVFDRERRRMMDSRDGLNRGGGE